MNLSFETKNFHLSIGGKSKDLIRDKQGNVSGYVRNTLYDIASPYVASDNFITLYETVPEVFFPVRYLVDKIVKGNFMLKSIKDDSVIFNNDSINKLLTQPNALQSFDEFVSLHFLYKFLTGNSFIKASVFSQTQKELWRRCDDYWVLPSGSVDIVANNNAPLFSPASISEIIQYYRLSYSGIMDDMAPEIVLHVKEPNVNTLDCSFKGKSRLVSQIKPISNLISVYEARNVIYTKRGALGIIVSRKKDETGTVALTPDEKENIRKEYDTVYGLGGDKYPVAIIDTDTDFIRTSMSIQELQPFDETLQDAISIAGAFSIPSQLVPRKDNSTFDNQNTSERSVYYNIVIPEAKSFVKSLTRFLGLEKDGMYLDVDYSDVDALQSGNKERQQTLNIISMKCKNEFLGGVITLNDWRAQIGESKVLNQLYDKLIFEMSDQEVERIKGIISSSNTKSNNNGTA
jgi:hypothetical protein